MPQPLNILWIQTDEQRCDSLGCYGNPLMRTPNIDTLAARGTRFNSHYVQSPVCVPSRMCELTSHYPHQTGILNNTVHYTFGRWPEGLVAFPELFARAGYVTCNLGKFHTPEHYTWLQNWHFEMFASEARHFDLAPGYNEAEHEVIHLNPQAPSVIVGGRYPQVAGGRTPQTYLVEHAVDWLSLYGHIRRPFLLRVSFLAPHTPVLAPEPYYNLYDPEAMAWDVPDETMLASRPRYEMNKRGLAIYRSHPPEDYRRMRTTYYGLVAHIDAQVGRLLAEVKRLGLADNTLVVYSSDHGDLMGEYGQFQKGMFYDLTTRVPLILAGPGVAAGQTCRNLTEQVDLAPTLLRLAGLPIPGDMAGRDLLQPDTPREDVIGEIASVEREEQNWPFPDRPRAQVRRSWIRTARYSLDYTSERNWQPTQGPEDRDGKLIDYQADPLAHRNLYFDPAYADLVEDLQRRFEERTAEGRRPIQIGEPPRWE
ncbi:MAG: sulfatase family protein [Anaerolineae bacterium]